MKKETELFYTKDLCVGYNHKTVREIENLVVHTGKIIGIVGTSGIGKTTFLKTIAGLLPPVKGEIHYTFRCSPVLMHQQYTSFDWYRCLDNILIVDDIRHNKITEERISAAREMLKLVGLEDYADAYPRQLSGGQKQRLSLARVLYANPDLLLMDEPLSALDERTREQMQDLILMRRQDSDQTIIMVTHSREEAGKMCDLIIDFDRNEYYLHVEAT